MLEIIRGAGPEGIRRTQLYDRTRFLHRRDRDDILATLVESGALIQEVRPTATKPVLVLRAAP